MIDERRRFMRYRVKENLFAALSDPTVIVGKLKDLSMGGAAFEFIPDTAQEGQEPGQQTLDIFMLGSAEKLLSVPCDVLLREAARELPHIFFPTVLSRICVAQFKDLPRQQARSLLDFLMRYSVGYAS